MITLIAAAIVGAVGSGPQEPNFPVFDPWSSPKVRNAFVRPLFHDFVMKEKGQIERAFDSKINRLERHPWNRAQSTLCWYMLVKANSALNDAKSPQEADCVVRTTVNGWTRVLTYHQTLYLWHSVYQLDDFYPNDEFWNPVGEEAFQAKQIASLSQEANAGLPPLGGVRGWIEKLSTDATTTPNRIPTDVAIHNTFSAGYDGQATLGISVNDKGIVEFQEISLLTYAQKGKALWSPELEKSAEKSLSTLIRTLEKRQKDEAMQAIQSFSEDLRKASL